MVSSRDYIDLFYIIVLPFSLLANGRKQPLVSGEKYVQRQASRFLLPPSTSTGLLNAEWLLLNFFVGLFSLYVGFTSSYSCVFIDTSILVSSAILSISTG